MARRFSQAGQSVRKALFAFGRNRRGATAIEFAMLALPFALLSFAILETTVSFTAQQVLSNAADKLSRQIRTGQITLENTTKEQFKTKICDEISIIVGSGCPQLEFDLQSYTNFSDVPKEIPLAPNGDIDTSKLKYSPGGNGTINNMRLFYRWPVLTDIMRPYMSNLPDGKTLLFATNTWQNEPF